MHAQCLVGFALMSIAALLSWPASAELQRVMRYSPGSAEDARQWQSAVRTGLFERLHMADWPSRPSLVPQSISTEQREGYSLEELRIHATPGRTIVIKLARPSGVSGKAPAVVALHGHGGSCNTPFDPKEKIYKDFGSILAQNGFVVAAPSVGQHEVYEKDRLLMGERLWDAMRCVDLLASLPEVDTARIGCAGLSLGGEMAMWLGAMDERVAATVSCGFLTRMNHMEQNHCMCWKFDGLRELVDFPDIYSLIAPRPLQCQNGLKEPPDQFQVPLAREAFAEIAPIYIALGTPKQAELHVHPGAHEIDLPALMAFMERHLQPPRP